MARLPSLVAPPPPSKRSNSREGKRCVTIWLDTALHEELTVTCVRRHITLQAAAEEMVREWMLKNGGHIPR